MEKGKENKVGKGKFMDFYYWNISLAIKHFRRSNFIFFRELPQFMVEFSLTSK